MSASKLSNSSSSFCLLITSLVLVTFMPIINCSARPHRPYTHHHLLPHRARASAETNAPSKPLKEHPHEVAEQVEFEAEDNCSGAARNKTRREAQSEDKEDECLMKRSLMAHLDYIYTQNHTKSP